MKILVLIGCFILIMAFVLSISVNLLGANVPIFFEYLQYAALALSVLMVIGTSVLYLIFIYKYKELSKKPEKAALGNGQSVDMKLALKESKSILISLSLAFLSALIISNSVF